MWTESANAIEKKASVEMRQAPMLAMHTGQRQGDLRKLPWSPYDGECITLRQGKGGGKIEVSIRCTKALKLMLDDMSRSKCGPLTRLSAHDRYEGLGGKSVAVPTGLRQPSSLPRGATSVRCPRTSTHPRFWAVSPTCPRAPTAIARSPVH